MTEVPMRLQNLLLGVIALCLTVSTGRTLWTELVHDAHAEEPGVTCESWSFELGPVRKMGEANVANVEAHRLDMESRLRRMHGPTARVVYSSSFPILILNGPPIAYSGVYCVAP